MAKAKKSLLDQVSILEPSSQKSSNPQIELQGAQADLIDQYREICAQVKNFEAKKEDLNSQVKEIGQDLYAGRAASGEMENIKLLGHTGAVTFIVQKNFSKVSEEAKATIIAEGFGDYIERDQIQLAAGLDPAIQERILKALIKEFGDKEAFGLVTTQYKVQENALSLIAQKGKKALVTAALKFLKPIQQLRT